MRPLHRYVLIAGLSTFLAGTAAAATPAVTGLGQAWPNATDVSISSGFHVYRFDKQGVRYVQINDANGTVRGAVALIGDQALDLPVGVDANRWTVAEAPVASTGGETVYQDDALILQAAPQQDGTMRLLVAPTQCNGSPPDCAMKSP